MRRFVRSLLFGLTFILVLGGCSAKEERPVVQLSENLKNTVVTAHMEEKIYKGKNLLYCSAFQLAWNELKDDIIKDNVKLDTAMPMVDSLNKSLTTKKDISEDAVVAMAGFQKDDIQGRINKDLKEKFKGNAPQVSENLEQDDILAYGFIYKCLEFEHEFEKLKEPISFQADGNTSMVTGFGIKEYGRGEKFRNLRQQVNIIDYKSDSDFVISLNSKSKNDDIILAMSEPEQNLSLTIKSVIDRTKADKEEKDRLQIGDSLQIPSMDFDIRHSYNDLLRKKFRNKGFEEYFITKAIQDTRFKFDEKGAVLKSEAEIIGVKSAEEYRVKPMKLVFNKPYLIMLKDKKAEMPYFALWVGSDELLKK